MNTYIVVFQPDGVCIEVQTGTTILEAAGAAGVALDSACGGQGSCGKCKVLVALGRAGGAAGDQLTREEIQRGMVLACQATVEDDLVVEIPTESQRGDLRILMEGTQTAAGGADVPLAQRVSVQVPRPELGSEEGDAERFLAELRAALGESFTEVTLDLSALRALPGALRQSDWQV